MNRHKSIVVAVKTKSLGTITKYYPFIDVKTREVLDSVMDEAENYRDFVVRLVEKVVSEESSALLVYFSAMHASKLLVPESIAKVTETYGDIDIARPWILWGHYQTGKTRNFTQILDAIDKVLEIHTDDWLAVELLALKAGVLEPPSCSIDEFMAISEKAEKLAKSQDGFVCFTPEIYVRRSEVRYLWTRELEQSLEFAETAFRFSSEFDDQLQKAHSFRWMAAFYKNFDATKAIEQAGKALELFEHLDYRRGMVDTYNTLGLISEILGEVDQAIECFNHCIEISESNGLYIRFPPLNLARVYVNVGQERKALEILEKFFNRLEEFPRAHFRMAEALALLKRMNEATEYLESGLELTLQFGNEMDRVIYYITRGKIESIGGNNTAALRSYKRALRLIEKVPQVIFGVPILKGLIETEVLVFTETEDHQHIESAQLLLSRLEQLANEQNLHAISVTVAMLKADIQKAEGQQDIAREILDSALKLCQSSGMKTLRTLVEQSIRQLDIDESLAEMTDRITRRIRSMSVPVIQPREIPFTILGCIVMIREAGLEIYSRYIDEKLTSDPSMVAGLISAVSTFTTELKEGARGELQSIVHQDIAVLLEHGEHITCALLTDKDTYDARVKQVTFLERFEREFSDELVGFDGRVAEFRAADALFEYVFVDSSS